MYFEASMMIKGLSRNDEQFHVRHKLTSASKCQLCAHSVGPTLIDPFKAGDQNNLWAIDSVTGP